ncbi:MAG: cysteine dioxygenase [Geodermatophilaceae bacterium]
MTVLSLPCTPERTLDQDELLSYVNEVARSPQLWQDRVAFDTGGRHFASVLRDGNVDVWLLCWNTVDDTGWHDHDISSGAVAVVQGVIRETTPRLAAQALTSDFAAGTAFSFGPDHIHRMTGAVDGSVSIHAYSPPLWRMGQYSFSREGAMRRVSVSYADELRPLDGVAS